MLLNSIKTIIEESENINSSYLRNLIKEELQGYVLNFVYSSRKYNKLIFTGGPCLRKVYGLNRLSEDLDFDYTFDFSIEEFAREVEGYFKSIAQYDKVTTTISSKGGTVYLIFPILKDLNIYSDRVPEDIFLRCDFSRAGKRYDLDKNLVTAGKFQFFVNSYDLPTLFANKIVAFLERTYYKGKFQKIPFKGRDVYDLYWLIQLSAKSSFNLKVSRERLYALLDNVALEKTRDLVVQKIDLIDEKFVYEDLLSLVESKDLLVEFKDSFKDYIKKYISLVLL